MKLFGLKYT